MGLWSKAFAAGYCRFNRHIEEGFLQPRRHELLSHARGRVLEIGTGPGLNLEHYPEGLEELVLTEPEEAMLAQLEKRVRELRPDARIVQAPAQALPFEDGYFDTVVCSFTLCTVPDEDETLAELRRVTKPGGRFLFIEHVRAVDRQLARWQDRLHGVWLRFGEGCHCNRPTLEHIERSAFQIEKVERTRLPHRVPIVRPAIIGRAVALAPVSPARE